VVRARSAKPWPEPWSVLVVLELVADDVDDLSGVLELALDCVDCVPLWLVLVEASVPVVAPALSEVAVPL